MVQIPSIDRINKKSQIELCWGERQCKIKLFFFNNQSIFGNVIWLKNKLF